MIQTIIKNRKDGKMGKIHLYYKKHDNSELGDILKVKIDDKITAEVRKNDIYELEMNNGQHNIKMYYEGWTENDLVGYIDQNIEINGDTYFIYEGPKTIYGKGSLVNNNFNNVEEFKKYVTKTNKTYKILGIILIILAIIILIVLS